MSAEVENSKEEVKEQKPRKTLKDLFKEHCLLGIKLLELLICAICIGFSFDPLNNERNAAHDYLHYVGVMYTTYTGYMVINGVLVISKLIGDRIPYRTASIFAVIGAALFLVTGILLAYYRSQLVQKYYQHPRAYLLTMLTTSIIFAFVNSLIFFFETVFIVKRRQDF